MELSPFSLLRRPPARRVRVSGLLSGSPIHCSREQGSKRGALWRTAVGVDTIGETENDHGARHRGVHVERSRVLSEEELQLPRARSPSEGVSECRVERVESERDTQTQHKIQWSGVVCQSKQNQF